LEETHLARDAMVVEHQAILIAAQSARDDKVPPVRENLA
jgi:hypothetical protein